MAKKKAKVIIVENEAVVESIPHTCTIVLVRGNPQIHINGNFTKEFIADANKFGQVAEKGIGVLQVILNSESSLSDIEAVCGKYYPIPREE